MKINRRRRYLLPIHRAGDPENVFRACPLAVISFAYKRNGRTAIFPRLASFGRVAIKIAEHAKRDTRGYSIRRHAYTHTHCRYRTSGTQYRLNRSQVDIYSGEYTDARARARAIVPSRLNRNAIIKSRGTGTSSRPVRPGWPVTSRLDHSRGFRVRRITGRIT